MKEWGGLGNSGVCPGAGLSRKHSGFRLKGAEHDLPIYGSMARGFCVRSSLSFDHQYRHLGEINHPLGNTSCEYTPGAAPAELAHDNQVGLFLLDQLKDDLMGSAVSERERRPHPLFLR